MVFCPGHLYFDVSGTDSEAIEENFLIFQRPLEVARPEMLCLSKDIYQKYAVRMWQENICIVKTESGKVRQMELVRGHLEDSLGYLESIGEDPIAIQDLRTRQTARAEDYQVLNAVRVASQTPVEGLPNCVLSFAITLQDFKKQPFFNEIYSKVPLVHRYGPSGEWLGLDLRQPNRDDLWDRDYFCRGNRERGFGIILSWKAFAGDGKPAEEDWGAIDSSWSKDVYLYSIASYNTRVWELLTALPHSRTRYTKTEACLRQPRIEISVDEAFTGVIKGTQTLT
ncbi:MAG: hypothetical protein Q9198_007630 [Flavoplaca austrocitrina]